jgi:hypothetical protein
VALGTFGWHRSKSPQQKRAEELANRLKTTGSGEYRKGTRSTGLFGRTEKNKELGILRSPKLLKRIEKMMRNHKTITLLNTGTGELRGIYAGVFQDLPPLRESRRGLVRLTTR